jgi:hypothetical protein
MMAQAERLLRRCADVTGRREEHRLYQQFCRRWGPRASLAPGIAPDQPPAVTDPGKRALVIDDRLPDPGRDAGSQALLSHIGALRRLGYDVSLVAANEMSPSRDAVSRLDPSITVCAAPFYGSAEDALRRQAVGAAPSRHAAAPFLLTWNIHRVHLDGVRGFISYARFSTGLPTGIRTGPSVRSAVKGRACRKDWLYKLARRT